jgi:predicted RNA binding protein YcfA (HicA-like mRNA interferase family)
MARGSFGMNKDLEPVARQCLKAGWTVEVTKGNHVRWASPDGSFTTVTSLTGSGNGAHRAKQKILRALRTSV